MLYQKILTCAVAILAATSLQPSQLSQQQACGFELFKLAKEPSTHKHQVNTFPDSKSVYGFFKALTFQQPFGLAVPPLSQEALHQVGHHEIIVTLEYQEEINGKLRALLAGYGWKPEEQFKNFRKVFLDNNEVEMKRLQQLAHEVLAWQGFKFAAQSEQLGLEFFTEWTHTGSRLINNLNAFFFAAFLGSADTIASDAWEQFKQTVEYQATEPFRMLIETIVLPVNTALVEFDQEGMAISTALQDFRRKTPENFTFPAQGSPQTETLFVSKFVMVEKKLAQAEAIVKKYFSLEDAYRDLKANPQGAMAEANNIRREIGGTGFLVALQQAIKSGLISASFYAEHKPLIERISQLTNAMDKNNFEINLAFGKYEGDAIPSPYAFFEKLSKVSEII